MKKKIAALTLIAMVAFAANSVLCRFALEQGQMDPWLFTLVRLGSGALVLIILLRGIPFRFFLKKSTFFMALMLFAYAQFFSLAYLSLETGTGALIIFSVIQLTMLAGGILQGESPSISTLAGMAIALAGLAGLVYPSLSLPSRSGAFFMGISGIAWGIYSLWGKKIKTPEITTAANFTTAFVLALIMGTIFKIFFPGQTIQDPIIFPNLYTLGAAVGSGAVASAMGYVIWYKAIQGLSAVQAGLVQMSVPILASTGGILFLSEPLSMRFFIASAIILAGLTLAILPRKK